MYSSITQSIAIAVNTTTFAALDHSNGLNSLASRVTAGRVNRNTLATAIINQASTLGLEIARNNATVDQYAQSLTGMKGTDFMGHAKNIIISDDQEIFSESIQKLIKSALEKQAENGSIPLDFVNVVPEFADEMINNYVGKRAIHQLLGTYAKDYDWETIISKVKAHVTDGSSSYKNMLKLAGVRVASNLVQRLVNRGIVETTPANAESKPEMKLAAGCLYAYLSNDRTCESALAAYTSSRPLVDDKFIATVTDSSVKFAQHRLNQAINLVREADEILAKIQVSGEILNPTYRDLDPKDEVLFLPITLSTPALDAAVELMHDAKEAYLNAKKFSEMSGALKEILIVNPHVDDEERISSALSTLLNSVPIHSTLVPILAKSLAVDNGLPAQNILGTFVKIYGWDALQSMLLDAVEKHMDNIHDMHSNETTTPDQEGYRNWAIQASTQLVVKLAIAHLKPYINEGNFDKKDSTDYIALAKLIHDNKEVLSGDFCAISRGLKSLPAVHNYLNINSNSLPQSTHDSAAPSPGYSANVRQAGAVAVAAERPLSSQLQDVGLGGALQSNALGIGATTVGYASNAVNNFAATTYSFFGNAMPSPTEQS